MRHWRRFDSYPGKRFHPPAPGSTVRGGGISFLFQPAGDAKDVAQHDRWIEQGRKQDGFVAGMTVQFAQDQLLDLQVCSWIHKFGYGFNTCPNSFSALNKPE